MNPVRHVISEGTAQSRSSSVVWLIAKREFMANMFDLKIPAAFAAMTLLFLLSAHLLIQDFEQRRANSATDQSLQQDASISGLIAYQATNGSFRFATGVRLGPPGQPPHPLSPVVMGSDTEVDRPITFGQVISLGRKDISVARLRSYKVPDTALLIKLLLSLFALIFSVDAIVGERESGTLRAMLALSISRRSVLLGKIIGVSVSLLISYGLAYVLMILYQYRRIGFAGVDHWGIRLSTLFALGVLYGLAFIFLGLLISTLTTQTRTALLTALLAWGALVLVLPNTAVLAAQIISPAPSYNQLNARLYTAHQEIFQDELRNNPGIKSIFESPNVKARLLQSYDIDQKLTEDYLTRLSKQTDEARRLAILLPAGAMEFGASDVTGTGAGAFQSYLDFLRAGMNRVGNALRLRLDSQGGERNHSVETTLEEVSRWQRPLEPLNDSLNWAMSSFISLSIWTIAFTAASFWRFERYDVR